MKKRNVLAFMLCVWSVCSWAQKVTVSGTVIEEDTRYPQRTCVFGLGRIVENDGQHVGHRCQFQFGREVFHSGRETGKVYIPGDVGRF